MSNSYKDVLLIAIPVSLYVIYRIYKTTSYATKTQSLSLKTQNRCARAIQHQFKSYCSRKAHQEAKAHTERMLCRQITHQLEQMQIAMALKTSIDRAEQSRNTIQRFVTTCIRRHRMATRRAELNAQKEAARVVAEYLTRYIRRARTRTLVKRTRARKIISEFLTKAVRRMRVATSRANRVYSLCINIVRPMTASREKEKFIYLKVYFDGQSWESKPRNAAWDERVCLPTKLHSMQPTLTIKMYKTRKIIFDWDVKLREFKFNVEDIDGSTIKLDGKDYGTMFVRFEKMCRTSKWSSLRLSLEKVEGLDRDRAASIA